MIRRALLRLLGAPELADALSKVADLADQLEEYKGRCAALDTLAASEEARADEAERMLDRETMINKRLGEELARARSTAGASWLVPRGAHDKDAGPESISPTTDAAYRAQIASLRRDLAAADRRSEEWRVAHNRLTTAGVPSSSGSGNQLALLEKRIGWLVDQRTGAERGWSKASHELALLSKGAASCACSADARRSSDADEVLR